MNPLIARIARLRLAPRDERGGRPPNVRRWVNLADPGDFVAIPPGGIGRRFEGVHLDRQSTIHVFDFHRVTNYLKTPVLGSLLTDFAAGRA